ncbi:peptidoglycan-binding protein [Nocardiopsis exhalans]|uniref:Peptidoglycan-binding protein n=2 Tax=Nocardiopsis exhalans TaxID=163604 RepID=A0ABY5DIW9_9ACTN|nr:peptidoglycan-binding protein [Nocardiopsis exhalans]
MLFDFGYLDVVHAVEHFDERLTAAVKDYQTAKGLTADGVVGPRTGHGRADPTIMNPSTPDRTERR